ncbi:MAG: MFS transporter [Candidatus Latescibacter sp.]|nr:MFS transporter [Candidatus Latescibacter sp.]
MTGQAVTSSPVAERARRRIMRRILPYLFILYVIAYIDRANVGMAGLEMSKALGFTAEVFGFGAGIFFIGYFLLEIPGSLIVEKWSARGWIARIMISWGIVAVGMGFIHTATQFYVMRFLLGAAEAGFFPGIIVYLSHWFRSEDRAKAIAMFMAATPISFIIGSPISGLLLGINWFHTDGWRWLFIIEGVPAIIFGIVTIFYLTDWPHQAKWLEADEREWITSELEREKQLKQKKHSYRIWEAFKNRDVILLTGAYFLIVTSGYGLSLWLPVLVKKISGSSNVMVSLIVTLPFCFQLISMLLVGWSSDRTGERRLHTVVPMIALGIGLLLSAVLQNNVVLSVSMLCLAGAGLGYLPCFWSIPTSFLTGATAAATIGLINSVGNLGGFVGPSVVGWLNTATGSFFGGLLYLSLSALVGTGLILALRPVKQKAAAAEK